MKTKNTEAHEQPFGLTPSALVIFSFLIIPGIATLGSWIFQAFQAIFR